MPWWTVVGSCALAACSGKFTTTGDEQLGTDGGEHGGATSGTGGSKATGGSRSTGGSRTSGGNTGVSGATGVGGTIGVSGAGGVVSTDASVGGTGGWPTGGAFGTGGLSSGGGPTTGGAPSSGGALPTGGAPTGGVPTGGVPATGGVAGAGGLPILCAPGALACDAHQRCSNAGQWQAYTCGPLVATDVVKIDATNLPGFDNAGFRCKALVVCGVSQSCHYSAQVGTGNLASVQSRTPPTPDEYYDGLTLQDGQAVMVQIMTGAASQCADPAISISAGDSIAVGLASGRTVVITFPAFTGTGILLFVREDGATFYDDSLLQRAG